MSGSDSAGEPEAEPADVRAWREPTSLIPLKWGTYRERYVAGFLLIVAGTLALQGSNIYAVWFFVLGPVALIIGWSIMPARGWRRVLGATLGPLQAVTLLAGPQAVWTLSLALVLWLTVRHRPARSYVTVLFPIASGVILAQFFEEYGGMPLALTLSVSVLVASAWLARLIAKQGGTAKNLPTLSQTR